MIDMIGMIGMGGDSVGAGRSQDGVDARRGAAPAVTMDEVSERAEVGKGSNPCTNLARTLQYNSTVRARSDGVISPPMPRCGPVCATASELRHPKPKRLRITTRFRSNSLMIH